MKQENQSKVSHQIPHSSKLSELLTQQDKWNKLKKLAEGISKLSDEKQAQQQFDRSIDDVSKLIELVKALQEENIEELENVAFNQALDIIQFILKALNEAKSAQWQATSQSTRIAMNIVEDMTAFVAKNINLQRESHKLSEILLLLISLSQSLKIIHSNGNHKSKDQAEFDEQKPEDEYPIGREFQRDEQRISWENSLKPGMTIDCTKSACNNKRMIWSQANVESVNSQSVRVKYIGDYLPFKDFQKDSHLIAPKGARATDFEWRSQLAKGQLVDAAEISQQVWSTSVIEDTRVDEKHNTKLLIRFRASNLEQQPGKVNPSEWLSPHSARIHRAGLLAREHYLPSCLPGNHFYQDDANDLIYDVENKESTIFGIERRKGGDDYCLVRLINIFGQHGGFEAIIEKFKSSNCRMETVQCYLQAVGKMHNSLFITFGREYTLQLFNVSKTLLLETKDANLLRTYEKERIENIIEELDVILSRSILSSGQKIKAIEQLSLDVSLKCFRCELLKQRIAGLKLIGALIRYTMRNVINTDEFIEMRPEQLAQWLIEQKIAEELYIHNIHSELIARSDEFLKFAMKYQVISATFLNERLKGMGKQDEATLTSFLTLLVTSSHFFTEEISNGLLQTLQSLEPKEFKLSHIDLIFQLAVQWKQALCNSTQNPVVNTTQNACSNNDLSNNSNVGNDEESQKAKQNDLHEKTVQANQILYKSIIQTNREEILLKAKDRFLRMLSCLDIPIGINQLNEMKKFIEVQRQIFLTTAVKDIKEDFQKILLIIKDIIANSIISPQEEGQFCNLLVNQLNIVQVIMQEMKKLKKEQISKGISFLKWLDSRIKVTKCIHVKVLVNMDMLVQLWQLLLTDNNNGVYSQTNNNNTQTTVPTNAVTNSNEENLKDIMFGWMEEMSQEENRVQELNEFVMKNLLDRNDNLRELTLIQFKTIQMLFLKNSCINKSIEFKDYPFTPHKQTETESIPPQQPSTLIKLLPSDQSTPSIPSAPPLKEVGPTNAEKNNEDEWLQNDEWRVNGLPWNMGGYELFWKIVNTCQDEQVATKALLFLAQLHLQLSPSFSRSSFVEHFILECMSLISQSHLSSLPQDQKQAGVRALQAIQCLLSLSEKNGIAYLKSLHALIRRETVNLSIVPDYSSFYDSLRRFDVKIYSNKTLLDLKILIASQLKCTWDQVKIKRAVGQEQLEDIHNGRTISDLKLKNFEDLAIEKMHVQEAPEAPLLTFEGELTVKAKTIFKKWFHDYSENGQMSAQHLSNFFFSCTNQFCGPADSRVTTILQQWDSNKDGNLSLDDFLDFYQNACTNKKHVVLNNIRAHSYGNDLRPLSSKVPKIEDPNSLPRSIAMKVPNLYELLFQSLEHKELASEATKLLNRLPASPELVRRILNLEGIKDAKSEGWISILGTENSFRLLYSLTIVEYLMEDKEKEEDSKEGVVIQSLQRELHGPKNKDDADQQKPHPTEEIEAEKKTEPAQQLDQLKSLYSQGAAIDHAEWREQFVERGGFDQIFRLFSCYSNQRSSNGLDASTKGILAFILRIMSNYLTALLASKIPLLYEKNQYAVQVKLPLEVIGQHLRSLENPEEFKQKNEQQQKNEKSEQPSQQNTESNQSSTKQVKSDPNIPKPPSNVQLPSAHEAPIVGAHSKVDISFLINRNKVKVPAEFSALRERLSGSLGQKILTTLELDQMVQLTIGMLNEILQKQKELDGDEKFIVEFGWSLLVDIALLDQKYRLQMMEIECFKPLCVQGLFHNSMLVRRIFSHSLYIIIRSDKQQQSQKSSEQKKRGSIILKDEQDTLKNEENKDSNDNTEDNKSILSDEKPQEKQVVSASENINKSQQAQKSFSSQLVQLLIKSAPRSTQSAEQVQTSQNKKLEDEGSPCNQFYELLVRLLEGVCELNEKELQVVVSDTISLIRSHASREFRSNTKADKTLIGLLNLLHSLLTKQPNLTIGQEEFALFLFSNCLFCTEPYDILQKYLNFDQLFKAKTFLLDPPDYVKCKSSDSRRPTYNTLLAILEHNKSQRLLQQVFQHGFIPLLTSNNNANNQVKAQYSPFNSPVPFRVPSTWYFKPVNDQKVRDNFLGIRNLSQI